MPTLSASHIVLDLPTLLAVTFFVTVIGGLLLLFAFLQNRTTPALALWGIGYLIGATGAALLGARPGRCQTPGRSASPTRCCAAPTP
jgi:hypothetical protein